MNLIHQLVLSCGTYSVDDWTRAAMLRAKMRKDQQPDRRTRSGKKWWAYIAEQERKCTEAYRRGEEFTPDKFAP